MKSKHLDDGFLNEVERYFSKVGDTISRYSGFNISFRLREGDNDNLVVDANAQYTVMVPEIIEDLSHDMLNRVRKVLWGSSGDVDHLDYAGINNLTRDISLSFIFEGYLEKREIDRFNLVEFFNDIRDIGAKSYENQSVDIGVVYCEDKGSLEDLKSLNIDFIPLKTPKTLRDFFREEKPLLRLVDNKSFSIVLNSKLEVQAIIRKRANGKSLSQTLEAQYNLWIINFIKQFVLQNVIRTSKEILSKEEDDEFVSYFQNKVIVALNDLARGVGDCPKYVYFSVKNKAISVFTGQKFVISYENGTWKMKHHALMMATIMKLILPRLMPLFLEREGDTISDCIDKLTEDILKFTNTIKDISLNRGGSIFVIILESVYTKYLSSSEAKQILIKHSLQNNNLERYFMNVIRNKDIHLSVGEVDQYLIETISSIDGAVIMDPQLNIISFGETINVPEEIDYKDTFGTGTRAARYASRLGLSIKVSEDGEINIFVDERLLLKI